MVTRPAPRAPSVLGMRDFRKLIAWQKAHALAVAAHGVLKDGDVRSLPGLRAQLLRAAASVPANLAEGCGKRSEAEFARFIDIAIGSTREVENHLLMARDLGCLHADAADRLIRDADEVARILFGLAKALRRRTETEARARIASGTEA